MSNKHIDRERSAVNPSGSFFGSIARLAIGRTVWLVAMLFFILLDLFFLPLHWLGRLLEAVSQMLYALTDESGFCLSREWLKKGRCLVIWRKQ